MSVTEFDCALAKSPIARDISGENLAPEVARQLETHIAACPRCKQLLQEKKSSLEAMIQEKTNGSDPQSEVRVVNDPIPMTAGPLTNSPMTQGSLALKPEVPQPSRTSEPDYPHLTLRERIREQARALKPREDNTIDLPAVAPAFAHKETPQTTGITVPLEEVINPSKKEKKKNLLSSFALWENIPDGEAKPSLKKENLKAAKAAIESGNIGVKRPALYLTGLLVVVGTMSFILKDPTALFGDRVARTKPDQSSIVIPHPGTKVAKAPKGKAKRITKLLSNGTTNADSFAEPTATGGVQPMPGKNGPAKKTATKKPATKSASKKLAKKKAVAKKPTKSTYRTWGTKATPTVKKTSHKHSVPRHKSKSHTVVRLHQPTSPTPKGNVVKLYSPESN